MTLVFPSSEQDTPVGGKARALAQLLEAGLPVPPWFVVPPGTVLDDGELAEALGRIGTGPFAVRSSAAAEDGIAHSFAGQFDSFLDVPADQVGDRVGDVRASAHSPRLNEYRREHDLPDPGEPAVLVQRMVDAASAGVAFSADPVTGRRKTCVISAVEGTGDKLVSGEVDGEVWRVGPEDIEEAPENPLLSTEQAEEVTALARRCEAHFERPQDIEWAYDREGALWLLQSRPITTLDRVPDPEGELRIWDNSNIAESYTGVTTPLTFTFARNAYEHVYRQFCRLMRVPAARIKRADEIFPHMLGLIRGRVYYDLINWYHLLALLPGYNVNRRFMEQMMGVKEPMPEEVVKEVAATYRVGKLADTLCLVRTLLGLLRNQLGIQRQVARFYQRLDEALAPETTPLTEQNGEELVASYRRLEAQLLHRWDAPLVNDFLAMIYHGALRSLCARWLGSESQANELLRDAGEIISAEPPKLIAEMATLAAEDPKLTELLRDPRGPVSGKLDALQAHPALAQRYQAYLERFGDRCLEELKLESPTLEDDPSSLLCSIGAMAANPRTPAAPAEPGPEPSPRHPVNKALFSFVLRHARARVRDRENLRFERTRVFGRVRRIMRQLGMRLQAAGHLEEPLDVFHLELEEVLGAYEGSSDPTAFRDRVANRKQEFQGYRETPAPPDRIETRGELCNDSILRGTTTPATHEGESLQGVGACPGVVRGVVRVVTTPQEACLEPGEILVAQQTDPGWVVLFPSASGLLVERGSLLSHSAIVSREMNLPCVVSLRGVTAWLQTGDEVEFDGTTGLVRKVS